MKKIAAVLALITLLASLSACAPTGDTERPTATNTPAGTADTPTEVPTEAPTEGSTLPELDSYKGPFPSNRGYRVEHILKESDTGYFEGKMLEELYEEFVPYGGEKTRYARSVYSPYGAFFQGSFMGERAYYDKQTAEISTFCPDSGCDGQRCVWHQYIEFLYVSRDHLYFVASSPGTANDCLWRCDHDRQNVTKLYQLRSYASEEIFYVDGDKLYMNRFISESAEGVVMAYGVYDCSTRRFTRIKAAEGYTIREVTADGTVWCHTESAGITEIFCADPEFTTVESYTPANAITLQGAGYRLIEVTDTHLILARLDDRMVGYDRYVMVNHATGEVREATELYAGRSNVIYSGKYMYYTKRLTDEEIEASPLKDYYTHTVTSGDMTYACPNRDAGRIYRMSMETFEEEFVLQITYNNIPIWVDDMVVEGNVLYLSYATYLGFYNYYDQNHELQSIWNPEIRRVAVADLSNGTVQYVEYLG